MDVTFTAADAPLERLQAANGAISQMETMRPTDLAGRFRLDQLASGDYKLFLWDEVSDGAWQDPEFITAYEDRGRPVAVGESRGPHVRLTGIRRREWSSW